MKKTVLEKGQRFCPKCTSDWDGGSILETFIKKRNSGEDYWANKTDIEIEKIVKESYSEPYRWGREIAIELPWNHQNHYDGVSYWMCPDCETTFNRFTGVEETIPEI